MGEPRPLMGEPRGPLMDARGETGGMKYWVAWIVQARSQRGAGCPEPRRSKGVWALQGLTPGEQGQSQGARDFLQARPLCPQPCTFWCLLVPRQRRQQAHCHSPCSAASLRS